MMTFDPEQLEKSFAFDPETVADLRAAWSGLIVAVVWDDLKSGSIGAVPRLRKRVLEVGENLRSLLSDRRWIPHERERVKGAMAASLNLRDSLMQADRAAKLISGGDDFKPFEERYLGFRQRLLALMEIHEQRWGDLLESLYDESPDAEEDDGDRTG
jgi:hypothetical protein